MNHQFDLETRHVLEAVHALVPGAQKAYLVGGALRDLMLGRSVRDLDFCLKSGSLEWAGAVRRTFRAGGFTLDDERQTARVFLDFGHSQKFTLDFVSFFGSDLEQDLKNRDYTVNAMALDLDDLQTLIDPLGGQSDLKAGILRQASQLSMLLDPLRALRGVRMQLDYGLRPEPATGQTMRAAVAELRAVSAERKRDELLKIMELPGVTNALRVLDEYALLDAIFPQIGILKQLPAIPPHIHSLWEHTLATIDLLEQVVGFVNGQEAKDISPFLQNLLVNLSPYREELAQHLNRPIQADRHRYLLLYLAGLYHDIGKPASQGKKTDGSPHFHGHEELSAKIAADLGTALALGKEESDYLCKVVGNHMRVHLLAHGGTPISKRAIYRYFRELGSAGVDVAVISFCDTVAARGEAISRDHLQRELNATLKLLEAWFKRPAELVQPQKIVTGNDLMQALDLPPSPILGEILEAIREAQVTGLVSDYAAAIRFARSYLADHERIDDET
jgi:poly(A) polymerase